MLTIKRQLITVTLILLVFALPLSAQTSKKALTLEEYGRWRSISSTAITDNGLWIAFGYATREMDDTLHVKKLDTEIEHTIPSGSRPLFSDDSKWVAYRVSLPVKTQEKLRKDKKPVTQKTQLINLETGDKITWENTTSFRFSKGSKFLAVKKARPDEKAKHQGSDLIFFDLLKGYQEPLGNVTDFSFNKPGTFLAYTIDAADRNGNGLYMINLTTGIRRPLDNDTLTYAQMVWDEEGGGLAVLKGEKKNGDLRKANILLAFTGFDKGGPVRIEYNPGEAFDFPKEMVISEKAAFSWSADLSKVFFGIKEQEKEPKKKKDAKPAADVDIWHWNDDRIQSVQMIQAKRDRDFTYRSVFNLNDKRFVRLTDEVMRTISITHDGKWGVGQDNRAYISDWKERQADYYRVNIKDGERKLFLKGHGRTLGLSPDSKHYLFWKDGHVWAYNIKSDKQKNLTEKALVSFVNKDYDRPGEKPAYGRSVLWTKDGKSIILEHKYDLWLQPLNGSKAKNLTGGAGDKEEIRFRYVRLDREERFVDLKKPMLLTAYGQWTKKAGFYLLTNGNLEKLIYEDKSFGRVIKAKDADKLMYTISTFQDFPNYYVSDGRFTFPKMATDANPWQSDYSWGRRILFDFENSGGVRLQGTLAIPETYKEGQKLPMHVNYYEKNSQNLHRYAAPRISGSPNFAGMVSNGYLVMQPDIHFNTRTTHSDMLDCIEAAVKKVIEMGYADPDRISLHGHSFSGQGSAYAATRSNMFAAIVYGAGATNLVSDFNQLWKTSGTNQHRYDTYGQGRFGTNPYDDFELYRQESAITHARTMDTPLLILHGTADGSVEWLQAIEFYNALRFNGKKVILLSYPGAGHGLRKVENQRDFQKRAREFLDHYLKDKTAPEWMIKGRPFIKKPKKLK